jgi:hypothetical protein
MKKINARWTILLFAVLFLFAGCVEYSATDTPRCHAAKSNYNLCYSNCLSSGPSRTGNFFDDLGVCNSRCFEHQARMNIICAK